MYNQTQHNMFIINALKHDVLLHLALQCVETNLQAYQRDIRLNPTILFPFDLHFDEIGVVIDKQSDEYIVGTNKSLPKIIFNDNNNGFAQNVLDSLVMHDFHRKQSHFKHNEDTYNKTSNRDYKSGDILLY